jgi:hypothetical protein
MHQVPREDQLELAEAIAAGARRRQARPSANTSRIRVARALGARRRRVCAAARSSRGPLHPSADGSPVRLPGEREAPVSVGYNKRLPLNSIILHLNDDHHWSREQIVDWLKKD